MSERPVHTQQPGTAGSQLLGPENSEGLAALLKVEVDMFNHLPQPHFPYWSGLEPATLLVTSLRLKAVRHSAQVASI